MKKSKTARKANNTDAQNNQPFKLRTGKATPEAESYVHLLDKKKGLICDTERRGHPTPNDLSVTELRLDASEGFIPLWAQGTILRWRFQERSFTHFANPEAAKAAVRNLFGQALVMWGNAAPIKFTENTDLWDFEIVVKPENSCSVNGCTLAKAFFPDSGRHELILFPILFRQSPKEQVDTLIHEIGHIFGLRHFFAEIRPTQNFGNNNVQFTIMAYGNMSELTDVDKNDLTRLYQLAWSGQLTHINGTPIKFMQAFHTFAPAPPAAFAVNEVPPPFQQQSTAPYVRLS